jgi:hypothetical protein
MSDNDAFERLASMQRVPVDLDFSVVPLAARSRRALDRRGPTRTISGHARDLHRWWTDAHRACMRLSNKTATRHAPGRGRADRGAHSVDSCNQLTRPPRNPARPTPRAAAAGRPIEKVGRARMTARTLCPPHTSFSARRRLRARPVGTLSPGPLLLLECALGSRVMVTAPGRVKPRRLSSRTRSANARCDGRTQAGSVK